MIEERTKPRRRDNNNRKREILAAQFAKKGGGGRKNDPRLGEHGRGRGGGDPPNLTVKLSGVTDTGGKKGLTG